MPAAASLDAMRQTIRDHYLVREDALAPVLLDAASTDGELRQRAREKAAEFVRMARANAERSGLIDKFLQEYGLSTREGVTLMRLAEALLRTPTRQPPTPSSRTRSRPATGPPIKARARFRW